jgi:hypothetical protein
MIECPYCNVEITTNDQFSNHLSNIHGFDESDISVLVESTEVSLELMNKAHDWWDRVYAPLGRKTWKEMNIAERQNTINAYIRRKENYLMESDERPEWAWLIDDDIDESYSSEEFIGNRFTVNNGELRLDNGEYEIIDKVDKLTPFGNFSNLIVKNLETGKTDSIPTGNAQLIFGYGIGESYSEEGLYEDYIKMFPEDEWRVGGGFGQALKDNDLATAFQRADFGNRDRLEKITGKSRDELQRIAYGESYASEANNTFDYFYKKNGDEDAMICKLCGIEFEVLPLGLAEYHLQNRHGIVESYSSEISPITDIETQIWFNKNWNELTNEEKRRAWVLKKELEYGESYASEDAYNESKIWWDQLPMNERQSIKLFDIYHFDEITDADLHKRYDELNDVQKMEVSTAYMDKFITHQAGFNEKERDDFINNTVPWDGGGYAIPMDSYFDSDFDFKNNPYNESYASEKEIKCPYCNISFINDETGDDELIDHLMRIHKLTEDQADEEATFALGNSINEGSITGMASEDPIKEKQKEDMKMLKGYGIDDETLRKLGYTIDNESNTVGNYQDIDIKKLQESNSMCNDCMDNFLESID